MAAICHKGKEDRKKDASSRKVLIETGLFLPARVSSIFRTPFCFFFHVYSIHTVLKYFNSFFMIFFNEILDDFITKNSF